MELLLKFFTENPDLATIIIFATIAIVVILSVTLVLVFIVAFRQGRALTVWGIRIGEKPQQPAKQAEEGLAPGQHQQIYKNSDDKDFANHFMDFFLKAKRVVLIGTGFYILHKDHVRRNLNLVGKERDVEIYAANPFSPNVEMRLIEEETGSPDPDIRKSGLKDWLHNLLKKKQLNPEAMFSLKLFPFYPAYALFIFQLSDDQHYFFYPYGYAQLGTFSPVLHYWKSNPEHGSMIKFLEDQYKLVKERSVDAELAFNLHPINTRRVNKSELAAFAVYLIPPGDSPVYNFGSQIIGYDIRKGEPRSDNMFSNEIVGAARDYGLHVTLADALYCATKSDIDLICREVEFLAKEFQPFSLSFSLEKDFPNERGIALVCHDKTGSLEALHHEMVARVYRKAVASNYNFDPNLADRDHDPERTALMIQHYHAPYILQRFRPHFSLLSAVPPKDKEQIYARIRKRYEKELPDPSVEIGQIVVMYRPTLQGHWRILQEYPFGGVL